MTEARARDREAPIALLLMVIFIVWALYSAASVFMSTLSIAGCGSVPCDYELQLLTVNTFLAVDAVLVIGLSVLFTILQYRDLRSWWVPATGILITFIAWVVAHELSRIALFLP